MRHFSFLTILFISCLPKFSSAQEIQFKEIDSHTSCSFRALSIPDDLHIWISGNNGWYGRSKDGGENWEFDQNNLHKDLDFRILYAFDYQNAIIANAGSPAYILRTSDAGENWLPVYMNSDPEIFLDGIDFWDEMNGVIYGDPIDGKMTLLRTFDGGFSWSIMPDYSRPEMEEGEASFAASGTGIRCFDGKSIAISSGGKKSRLFISKDMANTWSSFDCPIIQGGNGTGIFSFDINDENIIVVGGDYSKEDDRIDHIFISKNGGKTWKKPTTPTLGYRETVEFLTADVLISTGPNGTDISKDKGQNWTSVQGREGMHVLRKSRNGNLVVMAGRNGRIFLIR